MQVAFYSDYDGATLGTKQTANRFLNYKRVNSGTTATNFIYWWCSVSKEHMFIMIEGPRASDANADDATYGSLREYMFMSSLTPYFTAPTDPTPCAVAFQWASVGNSKTVLPSRLRLTNQGLRSMTS